MTTPINPRELFTPFLPTTYNIPEETERTKTYLNDNFSRFSDVINDKKIGAYVQEAENFNGEKWSYDTTKKVRNGYQTIARIKSFISETIPMPIKNINPQFVITLAYGSASKPCSKVGAGDGDYFSFFSQGNANISFTMSDTSITIVAAAPMSSYQGYIVIEYLKDGT
jgi:hypothetical protein